LWSFSLCNLVLTNSWECECLLLPSHYLWTLSQVS
jgi:hypothetical protein